MRPRVLTDNTESVRAAALAAYVMVKFFGVIFLGQPREAGLKNAHDANRLEKAGLVWLAAGCILLGYLGAVIMHALWNGSSLLGVQAYFLVYLLWMVPIFGLAVVNVAPGGIGIAPAPAAVNEGSPATITVTFTDASPTDTFTATVSWGDGSTQTGWQSASFGDQSVGEQKNDAGITQEQGNKNANVSPALGTGGKKRHRSCGGHVKKGKPVHSGATTWNAQGNGNVAQADVDQGNTVDQSQGARQDQSLDQSREEVSLL